MSAHREYEIDLPNPNVAMPSLNTMNSQTINIPFESDPEESPERTRTRIQEYLSSNAEVCSEAAAIWARLHYGHAAYVDGSLNVKSVVFSSSDSGTATMNFDWTFQDGCSDIFREGTGYVEVAFAVSEEQLKLSWAWPEQPSTADEF
jgi:hypothetical protein